MIETLPVRRLGLASTLYLGVAAGPARPAALVAHAWLPAGDQIVTGESDAAAHRRLASFGAVSM